jgi:hypothetical protein
MNTRVGLIVLMALLLADEGEVERAVDLYALASHYPYVGNSRFRSERRTRGSSAPARG